MLPAATVKVVVWKLLKNESHYALCCAKHSFIVPHNGLTVDIHTALDMYRFRLQERPNWCVCVCARVHYAGIRAKKETVSRIISLWDNSFVYNQFKGGFTNYTNFTNNLTEWTLFRNMCQTLLLDYLQSLLAANNKRSIRVVGIHP